MFKGDAQYTPKGEEGVAQSAEKILCQNFHVLPLIKFCSIITDQQTLAYY